MRCVAFVVGLFAGLMQLAGSAQAFTCDQVVWAVQTFSRSQLEAMAAKAGMTPADREKAHKCLREAGTKSLQVKVKAASAPAP